MGRFNQPDTIIPLSQGVQAWDRYAYTNNNPVKYTDPNGHEIKPPPCFICNRTWVNYSILPGLVNQVADATAFLGCLVAGCHADPREDTVIGPTESENAEAMAASFYGLATPLEVPAPLISLQQKALDLHGLLDPIARRFRTTAVVAAQAEDGSLVYIVASSDDRLSLAQRNALLSNEIEAIGIGHAEVTALDYAASERLTPLAVAASRPVCPECADAILESGALRITRLR